MDVASPAGTSDGYLSEAPAQVSRSPTCFESFPNSLITILELDDGPVSLRLYFHPVNILSRCLRPIPNIHPRSLLDISYAYFFYLPEYACGARYMR